MDELFDHHCDSLLRIERLLPGDRTFTEALKVITNGLIEVIIYVQDMASQVAFYKEAFGLAVLYPSHVDDFSTESWVTFDTGQCILALHAGGQGRLGSDASKIVFGVEDINAAREHLLALGVEIGEARSPVPGVWVCDGRDPQGNPFSIESRG